jgi:hypothetical protein
LGKRELTKPVFREEVGSVRVDRVQEIVSTGLLEDTELALADRVHEKPREAAEERERVSMVGTWHLALGTWHLALGRD